MVCGNFEEKSGAELLYTSNADVPSIRCALAIAAQHEDWGLTAMDISTAFLNTPLPNEHDVYVVTPPKILE